MENKMNQPAKINFQAMYLDQFGDSQQLLPRRFQLTPPEAQEVQIKMLASGLSMADVMVRKGFYPDVKKPGVIPGYEGIAQVVAVGRDVKHWEPGQVVALMTITGNCTEYRNVHWQALLPIKDRLTTQDNVPELACLLLNYVTAKQMIDRVTTIPRGAKILIHNGAGGVGTALIQLLKLKGQYQLFATASRSKLEQLKNMDVCGINRHENVAQQVQSLGGMDVVFDGIGGQHLNLSQACLAPKGQLIFYGMTQLTGQPSLWQKGSFAAQFIKFLIKGWLSRRVHFYSITDYRKRHPEWFAEDFQILVNDYQAGLFKPIVDDVLALSELPSAHQRLESGQTQGKLVVVPDPLLARFKSQWVSAGTGLDTNPVETLGKNRGGQIPALGIH